MSFLATANTTWVLGYVHTAPNELSTCWKLDSNVAKWNTFGHQFQMKKAKIFDREKEWFKTGMKEAIHIWRLQPSPSGDGERYHIRNMDTIFDCQWPDTLRKFGGAERKLFLIFRFMDVSDLWTSLKLVLDVAWNLWARFGLEFKCDAVN